jgi:hypothetical protein
MTSTTTALKGRPKLYGTDEERSNGHRNSALRAYLKKHNKSLEDHLKQKQTIKKRKELNYVNKWLKNYLKDNDEHYELLEFIHTINNKNNVQM